ncbi:hypothetical protein IV102_10520 [bacterium]|nr:hypothetical protein [bacterium]
MKKSKKSASPKAALSPEIEAAFRAHAGLSIQELESLIARAESGSLSSIEQSQLTAALKALMFEASD